MKAFVLALALTIVAVNVSVAGIAPVPTAREIVSTLRLNEAQYLKIKKLEVERLQEMKLTSADVKVINDKFNAALMLELSIEQQHAYQALLQTKINQQQALGK